MISIDGEQFPDSPEAEKLLDILESPFAHVDIQFEIERMGLIAFDRKWMEKSNPYFKETVLQNAFRRSWNEKTSTIEDREQFYPAAAWLDGWNSRRIEVDAAACSDERLK